MKNESEPTGHRGRPRGPSQHDRRVLSQMAEILVDKKAIVADVIRSFVKKVNDADLHRLRRHWRKEGPRLIEEVREMRRKASIERGARHMTTADLALRMANGPEAQLARRLMGDPRFLATFERHAELAQRVLGNPRLLAQMERAQRIAAAFFAGI